MSILETRKLTRTFGAVVAAQAIDVRIAQGEVVGIIGSNGAGKTTFINMITGYLPPSAGDILFDGNSVLGMAPRAITRLGLARSFQVAQLFAQLSVIENLLVALVAARGARPSFVNAFDDPAARVRALEILGDFGIAAYADTLVSTVPQGARKLIDIAMAIVSRPRLLLLDEPTSGVSAEEKFGLMDTIMGVVRRHGVTVLFIEHDMEVVVRYVTRVLAFYAGEIIADGSPRQVLMDERVLDLVIGRPAASRRDGVAA
jgi:branched-chain amino acid transport system ATP-binding protein